MSVDDSRHAVYVVDDDESALLATCRLLRASGYTVKLFLSSGELLRQVFPDKPGCVILDLDMPQVTGLQAQDCLRQAGVLLPIIFLSGKGDVPSTAAAMRKGAVDFITKTASNEDLLAAVRSAIDRDLARRAETWRRAAMRARFDQISAREREVLLLVLQGKMNKETAALLGIDERSVKRHRTHFMRKLQVLSVAELIHLARDAGLGAEPPPPPVCQPPKPGQPSDCPVLTMPLRESQTDQARTCPLQPQ